MFVRNRNQQRRSQPHRSGLMIPVVAMALVVTGACIALALNRLWLESARVELSVCAEAAALAAGRELAGDDLLRNDTGSQRRQTAAVRTAARIAAENLVAGESVHLDTNPNGDIRFGRLVPDRETGRRRFIETQFEPNSVTVIARRTRARQNPVALLLRSLTGQSEADVVESAQATIENRVIGVRPFEGVPVPALPLGILQDDPTGRISETWNDQIENRSGQDRFAFDVQTGLVRQEPDGIPEIVLRSMRIRGEDDAVNVQLVDLDSDFRDSRVLDQVSRGWSAEDLREFGGELLFEGPDWEMTTSAVISRDVALGLKNVIGRCRICLLYTDHQPLGRVGIGRVRVAGLIAGRIMAVRLLRAQACEIVFQPGVLTTRTAVLRHDGPQIVGSEEVRNRYIYKLHLTE